MARFIDLDTVRQPIGTFKLGGKDYNVWPLRIEQIINLSVLEEQDAASIPQDQQFRRLVLGLKEAIPDCPEEELLKMDMTQFQALSNWMREEAVPGDVKNVEPEVVTLPVPAATML